MTNNNAVKYIDERIKKEIDEKLNQPIKWMSKDLREISFSSEIAVRVANNYLKSLGYRTEMYSYDNDSSYKVVYSLKYPINESN